MDFNNYIFFRHGTTAYSTANAGYSGAFSWWRNTFDYRLWSVQGHGEFCQTGPAITDDFGNLVQVTS